jgi:ribosomal protein S18 acetylase RimI-like enzyme
MHSSSVITVRLEQPQDQAFLYELYASTRQEELEAWGWPLEMRDAFLGLQFKASQAQHQAFSGAEFHIVMVDGVNAGRMIIHRTREELHLVDIALLPCHRNAGLGAALMQRVLGEAAGSKKPLRLHVLKGNRAARFYQRLGFAAIGETEMHVQMEWRAPAVEPTKPAIPDAIKLPLAFDAAGLQADLARILAPEFIAHYNTGYYEGDWSAVPLRSVGGRADHIYPDPTARNAYADTPVVERCPAIRGALSQLRCPQQAVRLLRLKAGSIIKEHSDHDLGFDDGEVRLHIPVSTNPEVEFVLNQVRVFMNEGECWYLNVNQPHRVANRGLTDRIHLVVDCVVNDWLREVLLAAAKRENSV